MKGYHSNSKLVFAYQDKESRAAAINTNLSDVADGNTVIRVVAPKVDPGQSLQTHHNYTSTNGSDYEQFASDSLVGVAVSKIIETQPSGNSSYHPITNIVKSITRVQHPDVQGQLFDIQLTSDIESLLQNPKLYKAVIELYFSSGETEDLILNLKRASFCKMIINPGDVQLGDSFPITGENVDSLNTGFVSYSISKAYRKLNQRKEAADGNQTVSRDLYGIGTAGYTPFTAPFGVAVQNASTSGLNTFYTNYNIPNPSSAVLDSPSGYLTSQTTYLAWFTGKSDMTRLSLPFDYDIPLEEGSTADYSETGVNLKPFFYRTIDLNREVLTAGERLIPTYGNLVNYEGESEWGQTFGWLSTFKSGDIVGPNGTVAVYETGQNYGVPPVFRQSSQVPNTGAGMVDDAPTNFWGAFQDSPAATDGVLSENFELFGSGVNYTLDISGGVIEAVRASRLLYGAGGVVPGTSVSTDDLVFEDLFSTTLSSGALSQYNLQDVRNNFYFIPKYILSQASNQTGGSLGEGSIKGLGVNPGANFFFPGCAGDFNDAYMPVFKGIARVTDILRYATFDGNIQTLAASVAADVVGENCSALDPYGVLIAAFGAGTGTLKSCFNGVDLVSNLYYLGHTYPTVPTGTLGQTQSQHIPQLSGSSGMMSLYGRGYNALVTEAPINDNTDVVTAAAQDIVFLNSAFAPDPYNTKGSNTVSPIDYNRLTITRNHPIAQPLNFTPSSIPTTASHFSGADFPNGLRPYPVTSRKFHADLGETEGNTVPPYPYAPTYFVKDAFQKPAYVNYAGADSSTQQYFNPAVSENGTSFLPSGGNTEKALAIPVETQVSSILFSTGTNGCLEGLFSSARVVGNDNADLTNSVSQGEVTIEYKFRYRNACTSEFQTLGSEKAVPQDSDDYSTVALRMSQVSQIFPHIEYRPLAMLNALGENPFAYKVIYSTAELPDDIYIEDLGDSTYELTLIIKADTSDFIDINGEPTAVPYGDVFGDVPYPTQNSNDSPNQPDFYKRYISVEGEAEYTRYKASFITIAGKEDWETIAADEDNNQGLATDADMFAFHTPFITFGEEIAENDVDIPVLGCTDSTATNYNPQATVDDGSCTDCNDTIPLLGWDMENNGINDGSNGMRVGVYSATGSTSDGSYLCGLVGGNIATESVFSIPGQPDEDIYNSTGANYGGAVIANEDFANVTATTQLSVKAINVGNGFSGVLGYLIDSGETSNCWSLRIYELNDAISSVANFEQSFSNSNTLPEYIADYTAIYESDATGGTVFEPTWDNIVVPGSEISAIRTARPYVLELSLDPKKIDGSCTYLTDGDNNVVLGVMWVTFCSCANTTNDYFYTAMNGYTYPWQDNGVAFPIVGYNQPNVSCPDFVSNDNLLGDAAYPRNICFAADEALGDCDQYWLYCIADYQQTCGSTINSLDDAYQIGDNYWFDYTNGYITTNVEGVYNSTINGFTWDPNIQYAVTVTGPDYYETQTQADDISGPNQNIFANQFSGVINPGTYTVSFTFYAPYEDGFTDTTPCAFEETVVVVAPSEVCEEIIQGCTDETADNYNPLATVDDGTCANDDPCSEILDNANFSLSAASNNSDSYCATDTITVSGVEFTQNVVVPLNDGNLTATAVYTAPTGPTIAINNIAFLLMPDSSFVNGIDTILDNVGVMFANTPSTENDAVTITGIGYWSPLINVTGSATFTYQFLSLPPGLYYLYVVVNPTDVGLSECSDQSFIPLADEGVVETVGLNDPDDPCQEPCIGGDCEEYTLGCTDPQAENYNADATYDDGSCEFTSTFCEQNPNDELCIDCTDLGNGPQPRFTSGSLDETICDPVTGSDGFCTDPNACNYNPDAPLDYSNNQLCDYCSCVGENDADCYEDTECDPDLDPNCQGPEPECPDPSNPDCNPTIYDPCPSGDCGPPVDPCIILGNCDESGDVSDPPEDPFEDVVNPVEVTCEVDIESADGHEMNFGDVQLQAFQCMSQEGQKLLFRMKSGAYYDDTDILKLSLIAYLFAGGLNKTELPCLFNCNYDSADKSREYSCAQAWAAGGGKSYNSSDTYNRGDVVLFYYQIGGVVTRNYYTATRTVTPQDLSPRYPQSGWHRCQDVKLRRADRNNIATGNEEYLQVFWEFMTRFCNECSISTIGQPAEENNVDPKVLKNYLDPKTKQNYNTSSNSGIIGEDGDEIVF